MRTTIQKSIIVLGIAIFLTGLAPKIVWNILSHASRTSTSSIEFPLAGDLTVACDPSGQIYIGSQYFGRIQEYSSSGKFICGWPVDAGGGFFLIRPIKGNRVEVATSRGDKVLTYGDCGQLIASNTEPDAYARYKERRQVPGPYAVQMGLFPRIIDAHTGKTVITPRWSARFFSPGALSNLFCIAGVVLVALIEWRRRRFVNRQS